MAFTPKRSSAISITQQFSANCAAFRNAAMTTIGKQFFHTVAVCVTVFRNIYLYSKSIA